MRRLLAPWHARRHEPIRLTAAVEAARYALALQAQEILRLELLGAGDGSTQVGALVAVPGRADAQAHCAAETHVVP